MSPGYLRLVGLDLVDAMEGWIEHGRSVAHIAAPWGRFSAREVLLPLLQKAAFPASWSDILKGEVDIADDTHPTGPVYGNDCSYAQLVFVPDVKQPGPVGRSFSSKLLVRF